MCDMFKINFHLVNNIFTFQDDCSQNDMYFNTGDKKGLSS